jgi:hypothetical protein
MLTPQITYIALLVVQALHLLHHLLAKRHISFTEVISAIVLCVPPSAPVPAWLLIGTHCTLILMQIIGSLWIKRLSPDWSRVGSDIVLRISD